jgi:hypothetical protein
LLKLYQKKSCKKQQQKNAKSRFFIKGVERVTSDPKLRLKNPWLTKSSGGVDGWIGG